MKIIDRGNKARRILKNNTSSNFNHTLKTYTHKTIVKSTINTYADKKNNKFYHKLIHDRKELNPN